MQFLRYVYTLPYLKNKPQIDLKLNIPESIYSLCSFNNRVDSGFRPRLWDNALALLNCLPDYWRINFLVCRENFPLLKQPVTLFNPLRLCCKNFPALTGICTLSASGQTCSKSMALLLASPLIHSCRAIKRWWPLIALSKLPSFSLFTMCQPSALKWMLEAALNVTFKMKCKTQQGIHKTQMRIIHWQRHNPKTFTTFLAN